MEERTGFECALYITCIVLASISSTEAGGSDQMPNITCEGQRCDAINGSACVEDLCVCPENKRIYVNATVTSYCLTPLNLTEGNCTFSQQCNYDHGVCQGEICKCEANYSAGADGNCKKIVKNPLVPIIVGCIIAVAIVGTLLAYFWTTRKKK